MGHMTKHNLHNIQCIFEEKTKVDLNPSHRYHPVSRKRVLLVAAILVACLLMAACGIALFTPLDGDELTLTGTYEGNGILSVSVQNDSGKTLAFQEQLKLFSWTTGEEIPPLDGKVYFENTKIAPHSTGIMTIDLSKAYDIAELETTIPGRPREVYYYLVLTNRDFLFGHDWICSFSFGETDSKPEAADTGRSQTIDSVEEDLHFYFEKGYWDEIPAFTDAHFAYQQKVRELLLRTKGSLVRPVDPMLVVDRTAPEIIFDETYPPELQYQLVGQNYHALDGYNRIVGTEFSGVTSDHALVLGTYVPQDMEWSDGSVGIPLIYLFTYDTAAVNAEDAYAFLAGQIIPFSQLEACKVYEDAHYAIYNATCYFYTDLDDYLAYYLTTRDDIFWDNQMKQRVHAVYDYHMDPKNLTFHYNLPEHLLP